LSTKTLQQTLKNVIEETNTTAEDLEVVFTYSEGVEVAHYNEDYHDDAFDEFWGIQDLLVLAMLDKEFDSTDNEYRGLVDAMMRGGYLCEVIDEFEEANELQSGSLSGVTQAMLAIGDEGTLEDFWSVIEDGVTDNAVQAIQDGALCWFAETSLESYDRKYGKYSIEYSITIPASKVLEAWTLPVGWTATFDTKHGSTSMVIASDLSV